jgi:hypothetical protein|tara:strand:- start:3253 stop:3609 length:357 start_codon:yes stop_codon:yes gene_type:complete
VAITTASGKAKGRKHQQWTRDQILALHPTDLLPDDVVSTSSGAGGEDVKLSPAARRLFPYSIECKAHKAFAFYKIMEQAVSNCPAGAEPLVIIKGDRKKPLAVVDAEHFFKLTIKGSK